MSATGLDSLLRLALALLLLIITFAALRRSPKIAVVAWLIVICFVPIWIGVTVVAYVPAFAAVGLLSAISLLPVPTQIHWSGVDVLFGGILVIVAVEAFTRTTTLSASYEMLTAWAGAFIFGRLCSQVVDPRWIYAAFSVFFTGVAVLAIVEFITAKNLFTSYLENMSPLYSIWGTLQPRGGIIRAEGAFGHSIALGASLAIAIAIAMGVTFRTWVKSVMIGTMMLAAVLTFSRIGMATAVLGIVLACLFQREALTRTYRVVIVGALVVAAAVAAFYVRTIFLDSGDEAIGSAVYRGDLFSLVRAMRPLGLSAQYRLSTTGEVSIGGFGSIDNAVLLFGLIYGWVPLVLLVLMMLAAIFHVLTRRATPAVIAVVAQIPALFAVALITQYAAVIWFAAGMAVTTQITANSARAMRRFVPEHAVLAESQQRGRAVDDVHPAREVRVP